LDDQTVQEMEHWKIEAEEKRLQALKNLTAAEIDLWLQHQVERGI
jgi:hypothetical protein